MLERWIADSVESQIEQNHFSAAAVSVVLDGKVLMAEHYGFFDPVNGIPVEPNHQFMIGSITKTLNGIILSLLVEQGVFESIDAPVNPLMSRYQLRPPWGDQVTLQQLLTHSAGLESTGFSITVGDQPEIPAPAEYIKDKMARVVRKPGDGIIYSNFGAPIFGIAVEDQLDQPYAETIKQRILEPLGMRDSSLEYDPYGGPTLVRAALLDREQDNPVIGTAPITINDPVVAPAGSIQASARDMAAYMNALLGYAPDVLSETVLQRSQRDLMNNTPGMASSGLGIFRSYWNDTEILFHGGLISGFRSQMMLVPEINLGIFVSLAGGDTPFSAPGDGPGKLVDLLLKDILGPVVPAPAISVDRDTLEELVGDYWMELRADSTREKALSLQRLWSFDIDEDGTPRVNGNAVDPIGPDLFQERGANGLPPYLWAVTPQRLNARFSYASRVSGPGNPAVISPGLGITGMIMFSALLYVRRRFALKLVALCVAAPITALAALLVLPMMQGVNIDLEMFNGNDWRLRWMQTANWIGVAGVAIGAGLLMTGRLQPEPRWLKLHLSLVLTAGLAFLAWMAFLNLLW